MAAGCSQEHDGVVAGRCGRHSREVGAKHQHGHRGNGLFAAQRGVHIQAAEILSYRLQLLQHTNSGTCLSHCAQCNVLDRAAVQPATWPPHSSSCQRSYSRHIDKVTVYQSSLDVRDFHLS